MRNRILRYAGIAALVILMIFFGFKRERFLLVFDGHTIFKFLHKYPRISATNFKKEMGGLLGFSLSPKLTSSVLFSIVFMILTTAIIHLSFLKKNYSLITASLFIVYIILCFLLIQLGNYGLDYNISFGLSHDLEDLFLSPFPLMLLIPIFMIGEKLKK